MLSWLLACQWMNLKLLNMPSKRHIEMCPTITLVFISISSLCLVYPVFIMSSLSVMIHLFNSSVQLNCANWIPRWHWRARPWLYPPFHFRPSFTSPSWHVYPCSHILHWWYLHFEWKWLSQGPVLVPVLCKSWISPGFPCKNVIFSIIESWIILYLYNQNIVIFGALLSIADL